MVFDNASDLDGDELAYTLRIYSNAGAETLVEEQTEIIGDESGTTSAKWAATAAGTYWWTVEAADTAGLSAIGGPEEFVVVIGDAINEAPSAPTPLWPVEDFTVDTTSDFDLLVENAVDPESDILTYTFQIFSNEALSEKVWEASGVTEGTDGKTTVPVADFDAASVSTFFWVAYANDGVNDGALSAAATFSVSVVNVVSPDRTEDCECSTPTSPATPGWLWFGVVAIVGLTLGRAVTRR
jgi:hypothetical protein